MLQGTAAGSGAGDSELLLEAAMRQKAEELYLEAVEFGLVFGLEPNHGDKWSGGGQPASLHERCVIFCL
ncbi:MAG: hypothetical protein LBP22_00020 [Deltaproteobacteria bacterium]|nr:hypothetical protein [Deltaproteobacteria bacterium]